MSDPERVVSEIFSAYGKGESSKTEWSSLLRSDNEKLALERSGAYRVTFKYRAVEAPSADGFYFFVVRTDAGFAKDKTFLNDKASTKWFDTAGAVGTKRIEFTLGDFDDYYLIWGIHG